MSQYTVSPSITGNVDFDLGSWSGYNYFPVDCTSGSLTITLPTSCWSGLSFIFNRTDANLLTTLTINCHTGTIQGGASLAVSGKSYVEVVFDGSNWMAPRVNYI